MPEQTSVDVKVMELADVIVQSASVHLANNFWVHSTPELWTHDGATWRVTVMAYAERISVAAPKENP